MITEIARAVLYLDERIDRILIHPERAAELYREMDRMRWYNDETREVYTGIPQHAFGPDAEGANQDDIFGVLR
jgi:hypothetical protein